MKVSIITTIYKAEKDLPRLLDSMMAQKSPELEFFLIDNGSPDKCGEICREYMKKDSRFVLYELKDNIGYIRARNLGIQECTGDYIGFCDSDDYLEPGGYDRVLEVLQNEKIDLYIGEYNAVYNEYAQRIKLPFQYGIYKDSMLQEAIIPQVFGILKNRNMLQGFAWKHVYRKDLILQGKMEFKVELKPYEDQIFNIEVIQKSERIYVDENVIYNYVVNPDSITSKLVLEFSPAKEIERILKLFNEKKTRAEREIEKEAVSNQMLEMLYVVFLNIAKSNNRNYKMFTDEYNSELFDFILKYSSNDLNPKLRLTKFCLRHRFYNFLVCTIRLFLNTRNKLR